MSRSDTEVLQELKEARARMETPNMELKSYHALVIDLEPQVDPLLDTTLDEYLRIIKRGI
jgi:hypothetical protein